MMLSSLVSSEEKKYIQDGCNSNIRADGRKCNDLRFFRVENSIFPHTNGSSRIKIGINTDVVCAVKMEVMEPDVSSPDQGCIEFGIDISPSCEFSGNLKRVSDYANLLSQQLDRYCSLLVLFDLFITSLVPYFILSTFQFLC